ncbi:hypothetical protein MKX01_019014 [Papaver californicum]|nr:hypothetical protein MKX01_019014 [Papaver californicum]
MDPSSHIYINQQNITSPQGPVTIFWDIENCQVPSDVCPEDVAGNIRMALRVHPIFQGAAVTLFSTYGDFSAFPKRLREGCQRTGVKLVDVPNGRKDAADKAILVDMFLFALDNPPPSTILLISGDVDFSPALHILGQRGYTIILVIPAGVAVSSSLTKAGRFVWDWPSVARGEGFAHPKMPMSHGYLRGGQLNENPDTQNDEEATFYRGIAHNEYVAQTNINQHKSHNLHSRSTSPPSGLNGVIANEEDPKMLVQPRDIIGLKGQLVKLLELSGGCLPLVRVPGDYNKVFGRPLCMAEYGVNKLGNLLKKMSETMTVEGEGVKMYVYLHNGDGRQEKVENNNQLAVSSKKEWRVKGCQEETVCTTQNDEEANSYSRNSQSGLNDVPVMPTNEEEVTTWVQRPGDIISLKGQLVKLLELSGGCLPLARVPGDYSKIFGQQLCMAEYGVRKLFDLLKMIADTMTVEGEGQKRHVHLCNANVRHEKVENSNQPSVFPKKDEKGKGCQVETVDSTIPGCSSDEFSDDDKRVMLGPTSKSNDSLKQLKQEMQELLVSCSCKIHLDSFEEVYKQRYKKDLHHQSFGLRDDVNLYKERESKRKFLVPNFAKLCFQAF